MTDDTEHIMHYVPGEVCVVVGATSNNLDELTGAVRDRLNHGLAQALSQTPAASDRFSADLRPGRLPTHAQLGVSSHPLSAVRIAGPQHSVLCRFPLQIGDQDASTQYDSVRELVNLINQDLFGGRGLATAPGPQLPIVAATPNWLASTAQHSAAGPASSPRSIAPPADARAGRWQFRFPDDALTALTDRARHQPSAQAENVVVAIVDTSPSSAQIQDAVKRYPANTYLRELAESVEFDSTRPDLSHLAGMRTNWGDNGSHSADEYRMDDHGLFVAGIVHDVAPGARVHLVPGLSETGVGDVVSLAEKLTSLPGALLTKPGQKLVINLSLTADFPRRDRLERLWFPTSRQNAAEWRRRHLDAESIFSLIQQSLHHVITALGARDDVLIVAAAGNGNFAARDRPEPALPARYDTVLSVAAVDRRLEPSRFSNRGDVVSLGNGVATFGGEANPPRMGRPPLIPQPRNPAQIDAVAGVFSAPQLPLGGSENPSGWVGWSGTSFAAPIVAGIAASVWAEEPELSPRQVMGRVIGYATHRSNALACPIVPASQEWVPGT